MAKAAAQIRLPPQHQHCCTLHCYPGTRSHTAVKTAD
jgi:hypothetical protein